MVAGAGYTGGILAVGVGKFTKLLRASGCGLFQQTKENEMATSKQKDIENPKGHIAMRTPPIISKREQEVARQQLLVEEKAS